MEDFIKMKIFRIYKTPQQLQKIEKKGQMKSDEMSQARSQKRSDEISQSRSLKKSDEKSQARSQKRSIKDGASVKSS